jgi:hypothetical protein
MSIKVTEDITPEHLRCGAGTCPAVLMLSNGELLIIGKKPSEALSQQVQGKVADDEFAVVLKPEYFERLRMGRSSI